MSKLVTTQKKKYKTFEEICPEWNAYISSLLQQGIAIDRFGSFIPKYKQLDIHHPMFCIVGEAWDWSNDYSMECDSCCHFSGGFCHSFTNGIRKENIEAFVQHFNEAHL